MLLASLLTRFLGPPILLILSIYYLHWVTWFLVAGVVGVLYWMMNRKEERRWNRIYAIKKES
jgi:hypothetical protein